MGDLSGNNEIVKAQNEKKLQHALDKYIVFSFAVVIIYTIFQFVLAIFTGISLDTLTTCVFGLFGGEILCCAMIKRYKLKEDNKEAEE